MFLPGGQTGLGLLAAANAVKYRWSASPHTDLIAGSCCPKKNRATTPKDPCGTRSACPCPARPTSHANNCTWHPTAEHSSFVLLVYWPRELDTHTNAEINIGQFL